MYIPLPRKYRPKNFDEVIGQDHITITLKNGISSGRISQAYLFYGPRGSGKTSVARILAKSLNCEKGTVPICCDNCVFCHQINVGSSIDVIEIDGASNRGINEIRSLREKVAFATSSARFKVYIIDEVHMLTPEAFNALLKTLEEPPEHVVFVFATTEPHKLPKTIVSRTCGFEFKKIGRDEIEKELRRIGRCEGFKVKDGVYKLISQLAEGSLRDAETMLDQVVSYNEEATENDVRRLMGICNPEAISSLLSKMVEKDMGSAIESTKQLIDTGASPEQIMRSLMDEINRMFFPVLSEREKRVDIDWLIKTADILRDTNEWMRKLPANSDLLLEMAIVKICRIERIEKDISVSKEEVERVWSDILDMVKEAKPPLKSALSDGMVIGTDDHTVLIGFSRNVVLHKQIVEKEENRRIIEEQLQRLLKKPITVSVSFLDTESEKVVQSKEESLVKRACEIFDAEIVRG
jgi:DNA polymerase-3 subunit gamma/tau